MGKYGQMHSTCERNLWKINVTFLLGISLVIEVYPEDPCKDAGKIGNQRKISKSSMQKSARVLRWLLVY